MILVDAAVGSRELRDLIGRQGIPCDCTHLDFADACFEGQGPHGLTGIGVERKRVSDMLNSIDTGRYTGHQRVGMSQMYGLSILIIEGYWKPDLRSGLLLEGHPKSDGSVFWSPQRPGGSKVMYHKLRRYLFSVALSGVLILYTRDIGQTAYDICELYHYFQKPWRDHKSLLALHRGYFWRHQTSHTDSLMSIPTLNKKPSLVRMWAAQVDGIGVQYSGDAERIFKSPRELANADEAEWYEVPGLGMASAKSIVRQIMGVR